MLKETHTVDYVGHSFPEVGWYGKICLFSLWILVVKSAVRIWIGLDGFFPSLTSQPTPEAPHNRTKYQQTTCAMQFSPCLFLHGFCPVFHYAERNHAVDYVGQSFPEVGWYGKTCLFSLWILVVKSAVRIWIGLDGFFPALTSQPTPAAPHNRTKYQQTTCAMQFSPCLFLHGFCPVFQHAERNHAVDYVGQSFPEVGWYGKTCLYSLWILLMKSAVRIWIGLDVFFHHSLRKQQAAPHNRTKYQQPTCEMQCSPCVFLHGFCPVFQHAERDTCSRLCWPKFSRGWLVR